MPLDAARPNPPGDRRRDFVDENLSWLLNDPSYREAVAELVVDALVANGGARLVGEEWEKLQDRLAAVAWGLLAERWRAAA